MTTTIFRAGVILLVVGEGNWASAQSAAETKFRELEQKATANSAEARKEAAKELAEFGWVVTMPILQKLLDDGDAGVQREAVLTMRGAVKKCGLLPLPRERVSPKGPYWDGLMFQDKVGKRIEALTGRVKELAKQDDADIRAAAKEILHRLDVVSVATTLKLKAGRGDAQEADWAKRVKVEKGELIDARDQTLAQLTRPHESVSCWTFTSDGRLLVVGIRFDSAAGKSKASGGTVKGALRVYDTETGESLGAAGGYFGPVTHVAFDKDGKTLLCETGDIKEIGGK